MSFRWLSFLLVLLFMSSCVKEKEAYQGSFIQADSMVVILAELQIADALQAHFALNQSGKPVNQSVVYLSILKKHQTDRESFSKTMGYYSRNLEEFRELYGKVEVYIQEMQAGEGVTDTVATPKQ